MQAAFLKKTISELLKFLDVDVTEIIVSEGQRTVVAITSEDSKLLIGPHGEHLRSLNTIARRLMETRHGEEAAAFLIDVNGYHEERMEVVRRNAQMLAQRARLFKRDVEMNPMNPYERLVVHELFTDDPEIKTESAGEGKFRHVVLKYKEAQSASL